MRRMSDSKTYSIIHHIKFIQWIVLFNLRTTVAKVFGIYFSRQVISSVQTANFKLNNRVNNISASLIYSIKTS